MANPLLSFEIKQYTNSAELEFIRDNDTAISSGSYGIVWKAWKEAPNRELYAVKQLVKLRSYAEEIALEAKLMSMCNHTNVVHLIEVYEIATINSSGTEFIHLVLQPWAPDTLGTFLEMVRAEREAKYTWWNTQDADKIVLDIFYQLGDGLAYLHSQRIKHKDIKVDNILLYCQPSMPHKVIPVISDLGTGKIHGIGSLELTNYTAATPMYRSPEQIMEVASALSADVFAMGCTFLYLYAVARGGRAAVVRVDGLIMQSQTKQFADEIQVIRNLLDNEDLRPMADSDEQKRLAWVTKFSLAKEPFERLEAMHIVEFCKDEDKRSFPIPTVKDPLVQQKIRVRRPSGKWVEIFATIDYHPLWGGSKISTSCLRLVDPGWMPEAAYKDPRATVIHRRRHLGSLQTHRRQQPREFHWFTWDLGLVELEFQILTQSPTQLTKRKFTIQPEWQCPEQVLIAEY